MRKIHFLLNIVATDSVLLYDMIHKENIYFEVTRYEYNALWERTIMNCKRYSDVVDRSLDMIMLLQTR